MTITEFLEARIAEDETAAEPVRDDDDLPEDIRLAIFDSDPDLAALYWHAKRMLAECAAKRAIVTAATGWKHEFAPSAYYACRAYKLKEGTWKVLKVSEGKCNCGVTQQRNSILKPLAAVYADHPDYRQEWAA